MRKAFFFLATAFALASCDFVISTPEGLEIPAAGPSDKVVVYQGYTSAYNTSTLIPNWVAYELTEEETHGEVDREDKMFSMDSNFSGRQARREDYSKSGWTKGHMAPAKDMAWSDDAMDETFFFMNVCPQDETLNAKDWNYLEKQVRKWAREYGKVWVVSGPIIGSNKYGTIGEDNVVVPDAFFKAVMVSQGALYSAIAFVMGNDSQRYYLANCAMTVNELEKLTGMDFYPALPDTIEELVEDAYDLSMWGIKEK